MNNWIVYKHTSPSGKVYIGITGKNPEDRWRNGRGYAHNSIFAKAIRKYGWDNISHEILLENLSAEEAREAEQRFIYQYKANEREFGYNLTAGGDGTLGRKRTSDEREHMKQIVTHLWEDPEYRERQTKLLAEAGKRARTSGRLRDKWAENLQNQEFRDHISTMRKEMWNNLEIREKIILARAETNKRPEVREKRRKSALGKHPSSDTIEKMRVAQTRRFGVAVNQIDIETNTIINTFPSLQEAGRSTMTQVNSIYLCCRGKNKTAGGFKWEYAKEEETCV